MTHHVGDQDLQAFVTSVDVSVRDCVVRKTLVRNGISGREVRRKPLMNQENMKTLSLTKAPPDHPQTFMENGEFRRHGLVTSVRNQRLQSNYITFLQG